MKAGKLEKYRFVWRLPLGVLVALAVVFVGSVTSVWAAPSVQVHREERPARAGGTHMVLDVTLSNSISNYTLRYEAIQNPDDPTRAIHVKHAPREQGYLPLGLSAPARENWYQQGFMRWTLEDINIQDTIPEFRVLREDENVAVVEYEFAHERVTAILRFVLFEQSDKLLVFGAYESDEAFDDVSLRLMAYPATFSKPRQRRATTAQRTLDSGEAVLDPKRERWVLLEDTFPGRAGKGSAGLLLGDAEAFADITLRSIGGYAEHVDFKFAPNQRRFAFGLYEYPDHPDFEQTRRYFHRTADAESEALASLNQVDMKSATVDFPFDEQRVARIKDDREDVLSRGYEQWVPADEPLAFPWAADHPGEPINVALLATRYAAYDTMELARRIDLDVKHVYFDRPAAMADSGAWYYDPDQDTLGLHLAEQEAMRICGQEDREVFLVAAVQGTAVPSRVRSLILKRVQDGRTLMITGGRARSSLLDGWPDELTAEPADELIAPVLASFPWERIPGLRPDDPDRWESDSAPFRAYKYGEGRVLVFSLGGLSKRRASLVPEPVDWIGADSAADRILALHGALLAVMAGRDWAGRVAFEEVSLQRPAGEASTARLKISGATSYHDALVRVQDEHGEVHWLETQAVDEQAPSVTLPALPAGATYFVDVLLRDRDGNGIGYASAALDPKTAASIGEFTMQPLAAESTSFMLTVDLAEAGELDVQTEINVGPADGELTLHWRIYDAIGRLIAERKGDVSGPGMSRAALSLTRPMTTMHVLEATLERGDDPLVVRRQWFTRPKPYPYDEFTAVLWGAANNYLAARHATRRAYWMGVDAVVVPHMRPGHPRSRPVMANRLLAWLAKTGMHPIPYVTRIFAKSVDGHQRVPGLYEQDYVREHEQSIGRVARIAAPYQPAAYSLGDENYLSRAGSEVSSNPETVDAFRNWLREKYGGIGALNRAWGESYGSLSEIEQPTWIGDAAANPDRFAAWFDHKRFMNHAFAHRHETFADAIEARDQGVPIGFEGLLRYHWQSGYDFDRLTRRLRLNQAYTFNFVQGELIRSLAQDNAFTGEWANRRTDGPEGFGAIAWHNLLKGHNSVWWWSILGHNAVPFYPDLSLSANGREFFKAIRQIKAGAGPLLVQADRQHSGIAVLYNPVDMFAAKLSSEMQEDGVLDAAFWLDNHRSLLKGLDEFGYGYEYVASSTLKDGLSALEPYRALFLPLAHSLSDEQAETIRMFVQNGGTVIADGRTGLLNADGSLRASRPMDALFGVETSAGPASFSSPFGWVSLELAGASLGAHQIEPDLRVEGAERQLAGDAVAFVQHDYGEGQTLLMNIPFQVIHRLRLSDPHRPVMKQIAKTLEQAGISPHARLIGKEDIARNTRLSRFESGDHVYLGIEQDIHRIRTEAGRIPNENVTLHYDRPMFVYDMRKGTPVADERVESWSFTVSRDVPHLFALLPYRVTSVEVRHADQVHAGQVVDVDIQVSVSEGTPQTHAVRVDVYPPGREEPHREYSQTVMCAGGEGRFSIPFALNDAAGQWRLKVRDAASGVVNANELSLQPRE